MKSKLSLAVLLAGASAVAFAGFASAERGERKGPHPRGGGEFMMKSLDTNGDGAISLEEVEAKRAAEFAKADANGDGVVSPDEMTAFTEAKKAEMKAKRDAAIFAKMDTDGDGVISDAEFGPRTTKMFEALDADEDGIITEEERDAAREAFRAKWKERRGKRGERRAPPPPPAED